MRKNPHAVALGRKGGTANTPAQQAARAANAKLGGRPSIFPRGLTPKQRYHLRRVAAQGGHVTTDQQRAALAAVRELRAKE